MCGEDGLLEIQVEPDGFEELSYDPNSETGKKIVAQLKRICPTIIREDLELVSVHKPNCTNVHSNIVGVVNRQLHPDCLDFFAVSVDSEFYFYKLKEYRPYSYSEREFILSFPCQLEPSDTFGVGETFDYIDYYFVSNTPHSVWETFGFSEPSLSKRFGGRGLFAIKVEKKTEKIVNLKRYLYPKDWELQNPETIA